MRTLLKLLVLAAIVVAAYKYGGPALRRLRGDRAASGPTFETDVSACLEAARRGSEAVGEAARYARPETRSAWEGAAADAAASITEARTACFCEGTACRRAEQALDALDDVLAAYRRFFEEDRAAFVNPASSMERAQNLLAEARTLAE